MQIAFLVIIYSKASRTAQRALQFEARCSGIPARAAGSAPENWGSGLAMGCWGLLWHPMAPYGVVRHELARKRSWRVISSRNGMTRRSLGSIPHQTWTAAAAADGGTMM